MTIRPGARLGIDVGTVRVGVARSDIHAMLSTPLCTVPRGDDAVTTLAQIVCEVEAIEIVVGLPLSLSGSHTASTQDARSFAEELASVTGSPVRFVDERLSTVSAQQALHSAGRNTRTSRPVIDQVAATIILQHALDAERASGKPPGELLALDKG